MDDWQEQWWKQVEKTAAEVENFLVDVEKNTESFVEEVGQNVNSFFAEFGINLVDEVDSFFDNLVDVIVTTTDEINSALTDDLIDLIDDDDFTNVSFHSPSLHQNPACINCANYHGQSYNGNLLVCAMHPEGWSDDNCPDWEQEN
ncbi:MAG: hypothetical protein AAGE96_12690 [Cyanobacteria bacterium P01_G01_bin.19]